MKKNQQPRSESAASGGIATASSDADAGAPLRRYQQLMHSFLTPPCDHMDGTQPITGVAGESVIDRLSPCPAETGMVEIKRPVYSQEKFGTAYHETATTKERLLHDGFLIDSVFLPRGPRRTCGEWAKRLVPGLGTLREYKLAEFLPRDLLSGVSTGVMRIPQSMAYALLAYLSPVCGLYTAFIAGLVYSALGTSPHLVLSCQGVISLMVGQVAMRFAERLNANVTATISRDLIAGLNANSTEVVETQAALMADAVAMVTLMVGVFQLLFGLLRLGMLTNYLSDPLIGGFTTGAAVEVALSQLSALAGTQSRVPREAPVFGSLDNLNTVYYCLAGLGTFNAATVCLSACSIIFLMLVKVCNLRLARHCPIPVPGELLLVAVATAASSVGRLDLLGVSLVGPVPRGFSPAKVPSLLRADGRLLQDCALIAVVAFTIALSVAKKFALLYDTDIDANQEFLAYGAGNVAGAFAGGFVSTSSMSCSALHESLGGRSQVANLFASGLVLFTILFLGPYFAATPDCVLSAVILVNLRSMLCQFGDLPLLWRLSKIDCLLWLVTFGSVVCVRADTGLIVGVAFSLLTIVFRSQWPYSCVLGRIPHTDIYKNIEITPDAKEIDGVKLFRYEGSLYFASADHFRQSLYLLTGCNPRQLALKQQAYDRSLRRLRSTVEEAMPGLQHPATAIADNSKRRSYGSVQIRDLRPSANLHHVVLDFSCCSFIDSVGLRMLNQVLADYSDIGVTVYLSNTRAAVRFMLCNPHAGVAGSRGVEPGRLFLSNHDAVSAALCEAQKVEERNWLEFDSSRLRAGPPGPPRRHHVSRLPSEAEAAAGAAASGATGRNSRRRRRLRNRLDCRQYLGTNSISGSASNTSSATASSSGGGIKVSLSTTATAAAGVGKDNGLVI